MSNRSLTFRIALNFEDFMISPHDISGLTVSDGADPDSPTLVQSRDIRKGMEVVSTSNTVRISLRNTRTSAGILKSKFKIMWRSLPASTGDGSRYDSRHNYFLFAFFIKNHRSVRIANE